MRFKDVFSIIGPSMIGPSSSHTAGAVRLGRTARQLLNSVPERADITLYGSFADTYRGHGTDLALVAGLLDFETDDSRIRDALSLAAAAGMELHFHKGIGQHAHPNTVTIMLKSGHSEDRLTGRSVGGGNIEIVNINHFDVKFTATYPTLLIFHDDKQGFIAEATKRLTAANKNIGYMEVDRKSRGGDVLTVIEMDEALDPTLIQELESLPYVHRVRLIDLTRR